MNKSGWVQVNRIAKVKLGCLCLIEIDLGVNKEINKLHTYMFEI